MDRAERIRILGAYGHTLEKIPNSMFARASDLPHPKELIENALIEELQEEDLGPDYISALESGYIALDTYLPDNEYAIVAPLADVLEHPENLRKTPPTELAEMFASSPLASDEVLALLDRWQNDSILRLATIKVLKDSRGATSDKDKKEETLKTQPTSSVFRQIISSPIYESEATGWAKAHAFTSLAVVGGMFLFSKLPLGWHWLWVTPFLIISSTVLIAPLSMAGYVWLTAVELKKTDGAIRFFKRALDLGSLILVVVYCVGFISWVGS